MNGNTLKNVKLREIRRRAKEWINRDAVPSVSGNPPSPEETIQVVNEILDWRCSILDVGNNDCHDEEHCDCVSFLRKRIEVMKDAVDDLEMHAHRDIESGWVAVPECEWDSAINRFHGAFLQVLSLFEQEAV